MQQSASQGHFKLMLALLGAAVGIPVGSLVAFHAWMFQHPGLSAVLVMAYELILLLAGVLTGLAREIWELQRPLLVEWLNLRVGWMLSRYYKQYCQQLVYWYRDVDARGTGIQGPFTLQVEESFVELSLAPTPQARRPPILPCSCPKPCARVATRSGTIWPPDRLASIW